MIVATMKPREVTEEPRPRALKFVNAGATVREAAALTGASFVVASWVAESAMQQRNAARQNVRKGPRRPVYVDGVRLGRLALWK
jgi:hypothetical protein